MRFKRIPVVVLVSVLFVALAAPSAECCTTFVLNDGRRIVFGKNYDWHIRSGMLIANPGGMAKVSSADGGGNPARWTSRFGSVTFNQYGRDFPMGGMNEAGLVVELMWLEGTVYPAADDRATLGNLQWIQYQLDTARTVDDVLASDGRIRIVDGTPLHYLVADATGKAASVEFIGGRMVAHTGSSLPVAALTNSTYEASLAYSERWPEGLGSTSSLDRFATAAAKISAFAGESPEDAKAYAFDILEEVAQPNSTRWSIVYEIAERRIHFRTDHLPAFRSLEISGLDFSCNGPVRVLDLDTPVSGDIVEYLEPYSVEHNRSLIEYAFRNTPFLRGTAQNILDEIASYPEGNLCAGVLGTRRATERRLP